MKLTKTDVPSPPNASQDTASQRVDVGRILDEAPWGPYQKFVLLLVSVVIVLDGVDTQTLSLALPAITQDWGVGRAVFGPIMAASFIAMAIGTAFGGLAGDRFGRRTALIASVVIFGVGTLLGAACHDVILLGVTRLIASVGLGAAMPNATAMVAEYTPSRERTLGVSIAMGSVPLGGFAAGMLAAWILPQEGWRALFIVSGVIPLVGAAVLAGFLPESVRFLVARGKRPDRVGAVLAKVGYIPRAGDVFVDTTEVQEKRPSVATLFAPHHRRDTISLSVAFFCAIFATLALIIWAPSLLADAGYNLAVASSGTAMYSIGGLFGGLFGAFLFARIGSRYALTAMAGAALLCCLVLGSLPLGSGFDGSTVLVAFFIIGLFIPGAQVVLFSLAGQVFPTSIRATGVGFVAAVGRFGAVAAAFLGPLMLLHGNVSLFGTIAAVVLVGGIALQFVRTHLPAGHGRSAGGAAGDVKAIIPAVEKVSGS